MAPDRKGGTDGKLAGMTNQLGDRVLEWLADQAQVTDLGGRTTATPDEMAGPRELHRAYVQWHIQHPAREGYFGVWACWAKEREFTKILERVPGVHRVRCSSDRRFGLNVVIKE